MLPVINEECVHQAVRTGLGLKAQINLRSVFDRKNYFYPDLPQGYQISQYKSPVVGEGEVAVDLPEGESRRRSASSACISSRTPASRCTTSIRRCRFVDLNRSGVALMEIVSKPDLRSSEEAKAYRDQAALDPALSRHLRRRHGEGQPARRRERLGAQARARRSARRCEIKNVNSIRFIGQAIEHEARRQIENHRGRRHDRPGDAAVRPQARARRARCAPRKRRTTIAISRIPTFCRWN